MPGARPRIGYSTLQKDLTGPGDRRRFCHYAARRGLEFEVARPDGRYDLVVSSAGGDLSVWSRLPASTRFVLDMVDSYLAVPRHDLRGMLRGVVKYAFRHTRHLHLDYRALLEATCRRADAVICTTEEQREQILRFCPDVHVILDFQPEAVREAKADYSSGERFNLVWEGLPVNLSTFREIAGVLRELAGRRRLALHLMTDLERPLGSTHIWMRPTAKLVRRILDLDHVYLYQWNREMLAPLCTACDLAVIPIPLDDPYYRGKPENKLILFWRMGLPVVTSDTPAYARAMKGAGLDMTCTTARDWTAALERCMDDESARGEAGRRGRAYAEQHYSEASLLQRWDRVLEPLMR